MIVALTDEQTKLIIESLNTEKSRLVNIITCNIPRYQTNINPQVKKRYYWLKDINTNSTYLSQIGDTPLDSSAYGPLSKGALERFEKIQKIEEIFGERSFMTYDELANLQRENTNSNL